MASGYAGKVLRVDLTHKRIDIEEPAADFYRLYVGGAGFIAFYLLKEVPAGTDPLSPENKLIFALGPLAGTTIQGGGARSCVGAKSPLTGTYGKAEVGGYFGAELKRAGFDAIIVEGKAEHPVYIWVHDGQAEIRDASHLWGLLTKEAQEAIRQDTGEGLARTALIGPAGENQVLLSCVIMDVAGHAASHSGLGAVLGSKNLKGIAVRGHIAPAVADPVRVRALTRFMADRKTVLARASSFATYGTGESLIGGNEQGDLCVRNWGDGYFEDPDRISAAALARTYRIGMESCFGCSVRCKKVVKIEEPYTVDPAYGGPEYEALDSFGALCGVDDLAAICKANELCNAYGMNVISVGSVIALAMECFEKGLLTLKDTGSVDLRFGNGRAMVQVTEMMGKRQRGIGALLAQGSRRLAWQIGGEAMNWAMESKGEDLKMHDLRLQRGRAVATAVEPWGADRAVSDTSFVYPGTHFYATMQALGHHHNLSPRDMSPAKVAMVRDLSMRNLFVDCAIFCLFVPWTILEMEEIMRAVTGWDFTTSEMLRVGERIEGMARAFGVREGLTAADDRLPQRLFEPTPRGAHKGGGIDPEAFRKAVQYWYHISGYTADGVPTREKMEELGVGWVAEEVGLPSIM